MSKLSQPPALAGIDVSKSWLDVATPTGARRFDNDPAGHRALITFLTRSGCRARVVVEATGTYGLDLALALHADERCEVMAVNPRLVKGFTQALTQRSKTDAADAADAAALLEYARRMPFLAWSPPAPAVVELRAMARRIADLSVEGAREKNRLSALRTSEAHSRLVAGDIEVNIRHLDRRIERLLAQAVALIEEHAALAKAYGHLTSVRGIAARSAIAILPELLVLPADMTSKQWVAHAGLDPRGYTSGSSVERPVRISKVGSVHLRRALYMPAMVASRSEPRVKAFYDELRAKGKKPQVAYVAGSLCGHHAEAAALDPRHAPPRGGLRRGEVQGDATERRSGRLTFERVSTAWAYASTGLGISCPIVQWPDSPGLGVTVALSTTSPWRRRSTTSCPATTRPKAV